MKKLVLIFAIVLVSSLLLVGCGSDDVKSYDFDLDEYISLGDLNSVKLDKEKMATELTSAIDRIRDEYKVTEKVTDRPVENGDTVNIDFEGKIDGEVFEGGSDEAYDLVIGSDKFIPGLEEKLIGWNIGDKKDIDLVFPEDYQVNPDLAGKDVVFTVKINSISSSVSPAISDKMVSEQAEYATVAEFCEATVKNYSESQVWTDYLATCLVTKYPEAETRVHYDSVINYYKSWAYANNSTLNSFITMFGFEDAEAFYEYALAEAKILAKEDLVIYQTARKNNITLTEEQYKELGAKIAEENGYENLEAFEEVQTKEYIEKLILKDKIIELILSDEEVKYDMPETSVEPATEEPAEDADAPAEDKETEIATEEVATEETKPEETKPAEVTAEETTGAAPDETKDAPADETVGDVATDAETETGAQA